MSDHEATLSAHAHTVRLAFAGPAGAGKEAAMELIWQVVPEELRGELVPIPSGGDTLLGLDVNAAGLADGHAVTLRLTSVRGEVKDSESLDRLLARADGLLFFAGDDPDRTEVSLEECTSTLDRNGRSPDTLPAVFVHPPGLDSEAIDALAELLGCDSNEMLAVNPVSGAGLFDAVARLSGFVLKTWMEGNVETSDDEPENDSSTPNPVPPSADIRSEDLMADDDDGSDLFFPDDGSSKGSTFNFPDDDDRPRGLFGLFGRKKR